MNEQFKEFLAAGVGREVTTCLHCMFQKKICGRFPSTPARLSSVRLLGAGERVPTMERGGDRSNALAKQGGSAGKDSAGRPRRRPFSISTDPLSWCLVCAHPV